MAATANTEEKKAARATYSDEGLQHMLSLYRKKHDKLLADPMVDQNQLLSVNREIDAFVRLIAEREEKKAIRATYSDEGLQHMLAQYQKKYDELLTGPLSNRIHLLTVKQQIDAFVRLIAEREESRITPTA